MMLVRGLGRDPTVSAGHRHHGVAVWAFAVLLALAGTTAPAASAATGIATETRVGAIDHPAPVSVGSEAPESSTGIGVGTVGFEACVAAAATTTGGSTPEQGYDGTVAQRVDVVTETPFDRARVLRSSVEVVSGAERNRGALSDADARFATNSGSGASSAANGARLNSRLTAEEIAGGHSFEKHVATQAEFPGIRTRGEFADMIENVVNNYGDIKHLSGGRTAYWRDGVVVIRNPAAVDGGTAFVPRDGYAYFEGL